MFKMSLFNIFLSLVVLIFLLPTASHSASRCIGFVEPVPSPRARNLEALRTEIEEISNLAESIRAPGSESVMTLEVARDWAMDKVKRLEHLYLEALTLELQVRTLDSDVTRESYESDFARLREQISTEFSTGPGVGGGNMPQTLSRAIQHLQDFISTQKDFF